MAEKLTDVDIESIVAQQIELAKTHDKAARQNDRAKAIDYYMGDMDKYVPPEPNRSKVVSRDVADTIGWMLPGIQRVFLASDSMAMAEPEAPNRSDLTMVAREMQGRMQAKMQQMAQQAPPGQPVPPMPPIDPEAVYQRALARNADFAKAATRGLNYVFFNDNDGEEIVNSATWDSLMHGNAVLKVYYDDTPVYETAFYTGLDEDAKALLLKPIDDDDEPEVLAETPNDDGTFDLKVKSMVREGSFVVDVIPPEEFLIDADAITTEEAAFTDHWTRKTRSSLVAMGYDKETIWAIPASARVSTSEQASRDPAQGSTESTDKSMEMVDYHECFMRVDVDGDGEAELVRACFGGNGSVGTGGSSGKLLHSEVWEDENPFCDIKCEPVPHRWIARSIADETIDIQDIKTVLWRQGLNNAYWVSNPMRFATGKINNPDALEAPVFGGTVFGGPDAKVVDLSVPFVFDKLVAAINLADEVRQERTGVGRKSMALDPETLQNQSATAANLEHDAQYSQVEQIARNQAAGWRKVFRKLLKLMVRHQDYARTVMSNGKPVTIDPRQWNADMNVSINVGLGTGSRDRDLMMLQRIMQGQLLLADRFMQSGAMGEAIEMLPKIIETLTKMAEASGIKNPEVFFPEYDQDKLAALKKMAAERAAKPDPKLQAEMQRDKMKMQVDMASEQAKAQAATSKEAAQMQADLATAQQAQDFEREKLAAEMQLEMAKLDQQRELELLKLGMQDTETTGPDGEPMLKRTADVQSEALMQGLNTLGQMVAQLSAHLSAPTEIVRGSDGKAIGTRKVLN